MQTCATSHNEAGGIAARLKMICAVSCNCTPFKETKQFEDVKIISPIHFYVVIMWMPFRYVSSIYFTIARLMSITVRNDI
jgi:hypothetical protein